MEVVIFLYTMMDGHQRIKNILACMKKLEIFEFVYSMVTLLLSLLYLKLTVVNLQCKNKDIASGEFTVMQCYDKL